jgi:hypothetical protein
MNRIFYDDKVALDLFEIDGDFLENVVALSWSLQL